MELIVEFEKVLLDRLYPTEDFLEKDKLALVFKKMFEEDKMSTAADGKRFGNSLNHSEKENRKELQKTPTLSNHSMKEDT